LSIVSAIIKNAKNTEMKQCLIQEYHFVLQMFCTLLLAGKRREESFVDLSTLLTKVGRPKSWEEENTVGNGEQLQQ